MKCFLLKGEGPGSLPRTEARMLMSNAKQAAAGYGAMILSPCKPDGSYVALFGNDSHGDMFAKYLREQSVVCVVFNNSMPPNFMLRLPEGTDRKRWFEDPQVLLDCVQGRMQQ